MHEGIHFITHQARHQGVLKGDKNSIADETVAFSTQYDFVTELKQKNATAYVVPDAYSDPAKLPWNKRVAGLEKELNQFKVNGKYDIGGIELDSDNRLTLLRALKLDKNYNIFSIVKLETKCGITAGPLDYIAKDRIANDGSYSNTANFLVRRFPGYWAKDLLSKGERQKYHEDVEKLVEGLKKSNPKGKIKKQPEPQNKQSSSLVIDNKSLAKKDHNEKEENEQNFPQKTAVQVGIEVHKRISDQQRSKEKILAQKDEPGMDIS